MALLPDHAPDAVHEVAFVADQFRVELAPLSTELGLAVRLTVGGGDLMDTLADCMALPPAPLQVSTYVVLAVSAPVDCEPLRCLPPDQEPEAAQELALVDDQVSVALLPLATALGAALRLTLGAGALMVTIAD